MVYIYTEDEKEGFWFMQEAVKIYLNTSDVKVDTFHGIFNILEHISKLNINGNDTIFYVYDNIPDNTDIPNIIYNAKNTIRALGVSEQVHLLPIMCCEYEIIIAKYIELFAAYNSLDYILKLREIVKSHKSNTNIDIAACTKNEPIFNNIYAKIRIREQKRLVNRAGSNDSNIYSQVEHRVTVEKLCKEIFKLAFVNQLSLSKPIGNCWSNECCQYNNRHCNISIHSMKLTSKQKLGILFQNSIYYKCLKKIASMSNKVIGKEIDIDYSKLFMSKKLITKVGKDSKYRIINRIKSDKEIIGYTVQDLSGAIRQYDKQRIWQLAKKRMIVDVVATGTIKNPTISGVNGFLLKKLPIVHCSINFN